MSDTAQTGDATGANSQNSGAVKVEFSPEQQAVIDRAIAERLKRAEEQWTAKQQAAQAQAKEDAEKQQLQEQGHYKELYEKEVARHTDAYGKLIELQQQMTTLDDYRQTVNETLAGEVAKLGDAAKTAIDNLPGDPDALAKLRWLNANKNLFTNNAAVSKPGGTPPRNRGLTFQPQQQQAGTNQPPIIKL